jgi:hypothetical protein
LEGRAYVKPYWAEDAFPFERLGSVNDEQAGDGLDGQQDASSIKFE